MRPAGSKKLTWTVPPRICVLGGPYRRTTGAPLLCRSATSWSISQPVRHMTRVWIISMPIDSIHLRPISTAGMLR